MGRTLQNAPLLVYQNSHLVGRLTKETSGAVAFRYVEEWLAYDNANPVSLSLPMREDAYKGAKVSAVFENLLPDSAIVRARIAQKLGAPGTDAYSLLSIMGKDCVGALQFLTDGDTVDLAKAQVIEGEPIAEGAIEMLLKNLTQSPLGLHRDDEFRISVAGAQEKTALLRGADRWMKPHGTTPTTHIFKTQIGTLPNGINLTNSVENEFYCLKLLQGFGLDVNHAEMQTFGTTKVLVIERFDREWTKANRLMRLPQEDCCQALSVMPSLKYESDGGPGMKDIIGLLKGGDDPAPDLAIFFKAQILFWLIGATDGHAKNFSIFLQPGGGYRMTPIYDVVSAQPYFDDRQIDRNQMRLAMCAGKNRHYKIGDIQVRHFIQTGEAAGLNKTMMVRTIEQIADSATRVLETLSDDLPPEFPEGLRTSIANGFIDRLGKMRLSF
jgi:serine/threonine-protein kinase HipA